MDWREKVPADQLDHWEAIYSLECEAQSQAEAAGVGYEYLPWHKVRGNRDLVGKSAARAYWTSGENDHPWGRRHAHTYKFAFRMVRDVGPDWVAYSDGTSETFTSYDTVCVQHRIG